MQNVFCSIRNCGFNSSSGFCLNRLVVINEQGVCKYLTKEGWEQEVKKQFKSNFNPWQEQEEEEKRITVSDLLETRAPVQTQNETSDKEDQDQNESRKDRPPRD